MAPLLDRASPLRTAHLRDPVGPQIQFASESFIDEIAAAIGTDPVAFRLRYLNEPRDIAVVKAAAERAGWEPRPSPSPDRNGDTRWAGHRLCPVIRCAWSRSSPRSRSTAQTGKVRGAQITVAHDCGLIINPDGLRKPDRRQRRPGLEPRVAGAGDVRPSQVTSVDWATYPILDITDAPEAVDIVLLNRPDLPPAGAGEARSAPSSAAIANAVFDATGVRLRQAPFTPERAQAGAGVARFSRGSARSVGALVGSLRTSDLVSGLIKRQRVRLVGSGDRSRLRGATARFTRSKSLRRSERIFTKTR